MKIELKNVKYASFASHETNCFQATIYIDGKREGTVENDGHGGGDLVHPYSLQQRIDAYAATLPPLFSEHLKNEDGTPYAMTQNAETLIADILADYLMARDLKRCLGVHILYVAADGTLRQTKKAPPANVTRWLADPKTFDALKTTRDKVLNLMSFDLAFVAYKGAA